MGRGGTKDEDDGDGDEDGGDGVGEAVEEDGQRLHARGVPDDERAKEQVALGEELHAERVASVRLAAQWGARTAPYRLGQGARTGAMAAAYFFSESVPPRLSTCERSRQRLHTSLSIDNAGRQFDKARYSTPPPVAPSVQRTPQARCRPWRGGQW